MAFDHDTVASLRAAVALVNSAEDPDTLTSRAELDAFAAEHRFTGRRTRDDAELAAVRDLRAPLRRMLTADRDAAARLVNEVLARHRAVPQLVRHDGFDYHVHATPSDAPFADRIEVEAAMAMVDVIRADEMDRLAVCADETCGGVVLDLSRNRSRRFCSTACGNRVAAAAYRARKG
jgi:predicted RNA-binding Zn ribbon-like protein